MHAAAHAHAHAQAASCQPDSLHSTHAQLPTRRFYLALMVDKHVVVRSRLSKLLRISEGRLFGQVRCAFAALLGALWHLRFTALRLPPGAAASTH